LYPPFVSLSSKVDAIRAGSFRCRSIIVRVLSRHAS